MNVQLQKILTDPLFDHARILAGRIGIQTRLVSRISVFDCPYHEEIAQQGIIDRGDLFISCLEQFEKGSPEVRKTIESLIKRQATGLILVPTSRAEVLSPAVLKFCDEQGFPIIMIREECSYAHIMQVVNSYISVEAENAINLLRIDKIRFGNLSGKEKIDILYSINSNTQQYIRAIYARGEFLPRWFSAGIWDNRLKNKQDTAIVGDYLMILLSHDDPKKLEQSTSAMTAQLRQVFPDGILGVGRIWQLKDVSRALEEGESAVKIAIRLGKTYQIYDPLMPSQLLLAMCGCQEEHDFYNAYIDAISREVSADMLPEILNTVEAYVACAGNYRKTAEALHQHENTVRYRINLVKKALRMDGDKVQFFEIIAIATQLKILLGR